MKKLRGLDKYVCFSISVVLIYTVAEFVTVTITGIEKQTLTTCVYGFFAGEVTVCALLRALKIHQGEGDDHGDSIA